MMLQSLIRQPLYAPFQFLRKLEERAAMQRHRNFAVLARGAKILSDGWIVNPVARDRIRVGENTIIRGELLVFPHGGEIEIGAWCFVGHGSFIWSADQIRIGDRCLISHRVNIHDTDSHSDDPALRHRQFAAIATAGQPSMLPEVRTAAVSIADDVWIGFNASILKGVRIGRGAIIGAGSLVKRDVEAWTVVTGNPARVLRRLEPRG
jgi:acetyltransferase-like isoleucine patch superfamily enzyme